MMDLRKYYDANSNSPLESVSEGKLYAGKLQDDWYRYATHDFAIKKNIIMVNNNVILILEYMLLILSAVMKYQYISVTTAT